MKALQLIQPCVVIGEVIWRDMECIFTILRLKEHVMQARVRFGVLVILF